MHPANALVQSRPQYSCGSCIEVMCAAGPVSWWVNGFVGWIITKITFHQPAPWPPSTAQAVCLTEKPILLTVTDQCKDNCNATNVNM